MDMHTFNTPKIVMQHTRPAAEAGKAVIRLGVIQTAFRTFLLYRSRARTAEAGGPSMVPPVGEQPSVNYGNWSALPALLLQLCPLMHSDLLSVPNYPVHLYFTCVAFLWSVCLCSYRPAGLAPNVPFHGCTSVTVCTQLMLIGITIVSV